MIRHSQNSLCKHFQGYLGVFRDGNAYSAILAGTQLGGRPLLPFFENRNKCPYFGKKCPDCDYLSLKFSIQSVVLRVFWRKYPKIFSCGAFFHVFFDKMFIKVS